MPMHLPVVKLFALQFVSPSTMCRIIHRNGMTWKKVQQGALQRFTVYCGDFMAEVQMLFVWVDETGCDKRDQVIIRKFGYALWEEKPVYHQLHHEQHISAIACVALCTDELLH